MDKPISVGDLVQVVKWPCCGYKLGRIFRVTSIEPSPSGKCRCIKCGTRHDTANDVEEGGRWGWTPLAWVKRIDPLPESETEKHDEEIKA